MKDMPVILVSHLGREGIRTELGSRPVNLYLPDRKDPAEIANVVSSLVVGNPERFAVTSPVQAESPGSQAPFKELLAKYLARIEHDIEEPKDVQRKYPGGSDQVLRILHLSDIHLGTNEDAQKYLMQIETDLRRELKVNRLDFLVVSGDVAKKSTPEEYQAAFELLDGIIKGFGLDTNRIIIVPGNHDINWDLSEGAYSFVYKRHIPQLLSPEICIPAGEAGTLIRDEDKYCCRFANFSEHFYKRIHGVPYPFNYGEQAVLSLHNQDRVLFLAANSCWQIDHEYRRRSGIYIGTLSRALQQLQDNTYDDWVKIAVWHHPVTGKEAMNDEFMQLLAVHRFQIIMHGHIHEAVQNFYHYDSDRGIHIVGAGTFGAPARDQVPGVPLQYNLLALDRKTHKISVKTRKKEKPDGAWSADARWGDKKNPKSSYEIKL